MNTDIGHKETILTNDLTQARILVVDDEAGMRNFLVKTLTPICAGVVEAATVAEAEAILDNQYFDILILDNMMPGKKGIDWLAERQSTGGFADAILITAYADLDTAIAALRAGASDFVLKPFRSNQLLNAIRRCLQITGLRRENRLLRRELAQSTAHVQPKQQLIGSSARIQAVRQVLDRIKDVATPVLITGASGTGKEIAARALHASSARADKPFVPIACGSIPANMIEFELFGHAAGAFPGATTSREGLLGSARGGTVFFDGITDLPVAAQTALLRVIEDGMVRTLGSERTEGLDLRFIFSSTKPVEEAVATGTFREDLWFRINVLEVGMPPLSQRENDVVELAEHFMADLSMRLGLPPIGIDATVRSALMRYTWPGNIRELRNVVERSLILGKLTLDDPMPTTKGNTVEPLEATEKRAILTAIEIADGNRSEAARKLGISRKTIDRKCAAWGL